MRSFGIDPGSQRTGWGIVRVHGSRVEPIQYGVIHLRGDLGERLDVLFRELCERLAAHRPDRVVLESVFHHKNARSALTLGHARGVALLAAQVSSAAWAELSPAEVKKAVTGRGRAEKDQIQFMVKALLGLDEVPPPDAADALAVAIAGATRQRFDALRARAVVGPGGAR